MAQFEVPRVRVDYLEDHPGADALEIAVVRASALFVGEMRQFPQDGCGKPAFFCRCPAGIPKILSSLRWNPGERRAR